jgi:hypothetical protein
MGPSSSRTRNSSPPSVTCPSPVWKDSRRNVITSSSLRADSRIVDYPALERRACVTGTTGGGAAFASGPVPPARWWGGAVDGAPGRHNSHALARMLRELFRSA